MAEKIEELSWQHVTALLGVVFCALLAWTVWVFRFATDTPAAWVQALLSGVGICVSAGVLLYQRAEDVRERRLASRYALSRQRHVVTLLARELMENLGMAAQALDEGIYQQPLKLAGVVESTCAEILAIDVSVFNVEDARLLGELRVDAHRFKSAFFDMYAARLEHAGDDAEAISQAALQTSQFIKSRLTRSLEIAAHFERKSWEEGQ